MNLKTATALAIILTLVQPALVYADPPVARCITAASCTGDEFAHDFLWTARETIDEKAKTNSEADIHSLEACMLITVGDLVMHLIDGPKTTRQAYLRNLQKVSRDLKNPQSKIATELFASFRSCPSGVINSEEFSGILTNGMLYRRPLTDLSEYRANWQAYEGKTVRIEGIGKFILGNLFLFSSPGDMSPVRVNISQLSDGTRSNVVKRCSNIKQQCRITVWATPWPDQAATDLMAKEDIEFHR